jgi:hypothetical protein
MATYTEDFDGADKAGVGYDLTWTEFEASHFENASNEIKISGSAGRAGVRCDSELDGDDHYVKAIYRSYNKQSDFVGMGPIGRKDNTGTITYYYWRIAEGTGWDNHNLTKMVGGSETNLDNSGESPVVDETLKLECDGSSIKGYVNDVEKASASDSAITGNTYGGFYGGTYHNSDYVTFDDWEAGDLAAGADAMPMAMNTYRQMRNYL